VEEERVKSAFEIAMEKVSGLPELTPEEIAAQKEKECRPIGQAIANRYLEGLTTVDALPEELDKYQGDRGEMVRRALIRSLCGSIDLEDPQTASTVMAGITALNPKSRDFFQGKAHDLRQLINQFASEAKAKSNEFATMAIHQLRSLGISGSAVKPNLNENESWQRELAGIRQTYESRLADLTEKLLQASG